jgi:rubrerythrin
MSANSSDLGERVFAAHQRYHASGDPADEREWLDLHAEQVARHDCSVCERGGTLCRCTFDASSNPSLERKTDMSNSSDYRQAQLDAEAAQKRRADYNDGRRTAEAAGRLGPRQPPVHLRPLSETVLTALSKYAPGETRAASRAHYDAEDADAQHYREQAELHAKIQEKNHRELMTGQLRLDAADAGRTCAACDLTFDGDACPGCGGAGKPAKGSRELPPAAPRAGQRAHDAGGVPPWKRPLLVSSERTAPIPSQAMRMQPLRQRGAFDPRSGGGPDEVA